MKSENQHYQLDDSIIYTSNSPTETKRLGKKLGSLLQGGDFVAFNGELGAGKTCFIQGIVFGLGCKEQVLSPSFSLIKEYKGMNPIYHFDLYRLTKPEELEELGYEEYFSGNGITLVEWAKKIEEYLPKDFLSVKITMNENNYFTRKILIKSIGAANRYRKIIEELRHLGHFGN
ncbi:MAG: tRNA (adenosine(37)-N6)-threonylcarbamoyltransferase complex ATPase subunit type 1 TsaE [Candidatus Atribacteria bacterium]|nr:tRNA (adenosine(37)-N6)-threonylcarbamoyltransferase complex ATPase subunit type 1 TsaE [Candidatus Atribacteria bacterium]